MSGWSNTDAFANNKPSYITHLGIEQDATNTYIQETILVTASRNANSNASYGVPSHITAHIGWNNEKRGTGFVGGLAVSNVNSSLTYANAYLKFYGANTTAANGQIVVTGGNNVTVVLNSGGTGLVGIPTVGANTTNANNAYLRFTVTPGGRLGRIQSETLVALASPSSANNTGAEPWFTGV